MIKHKRVCASVLLVTMLIFPVKRSEAIIPLIAGWLLSIGGNAVLITDLFAGMSGLISGVLWYDCNRFSASAVCTNKPQSMPLSAAPADGITLLLAPDATRSNPDPSKFNDPAPGARDVTPKSSISSNDTGTTQSTYGSSFLQAYSQVASYNAGTGNEWASLSGQNAGADSTSVAMAAAAPILAQCALNKRTCIVKGPWGYDGQSMNYDIRDVTSGGDSYAGQIGVRLQAANPTCPYGSASDGAGGCVQELITNPVYGCPAGYSLSGSNCNLTDAAQVKKPNTTPCEILYDASANSMMVDGANSNCDGESANISGGTLTMPNSTADSSGLSVKRNSAGGFDIIKTDGKGSTTIVSTGPYDLTGHGYPIVSTTTTVPAGTKDGQGAGCGVPGKPVCNVGMSVDSDTATAANNATSGILSGVDALKGTLNGIDDHKFTWSFIPNIPTAQCSDPVIRNPLNDSVVSMSICDSFNILGFFINCVMALLCLYGCTRQIQAAMKA